MSKITLTIPVRLTPQKKPLFDSRSPHAYRPSAEEDEIGFLAVNQMRKRQLRRIQGPVVLSANIFFERKATGDLDHLISTLLDGIKEVVFGDDRNVKMFERVAVIENSGQDCVVLEVREARNLLEELGE